jgi:hypothetical protein
MVFHDLFDPWRNIGSNGESERAPFWMGISLQIFQPKEPRRLQLVSENYSKESDMYLNNAADRFRD